MKPTLTLLTALLLALPVARASDTPKPTPAANCEFPADWFLFGMAERNTPEPDFTAITDIPATLDAGGLSLMPRRRGWSAADASCIWTSKHATAVPGPAGRPTC